jgi:adsorption protein B
LAHFLPDLYLLDEWVIWTLPPLACYLAFSGFDDLLVDFLWLWFWLRDRLSGGPRRVPSDEQLASIPEKRIAIFVPLWHEDAVIGAMLSHNIAAVRYRAYDFFVGVYPNDGPTMQAVRAAEARFANVHLALCPHDGPTSKPDCLNWIYQRMLLYEEANAVRFDVIVTHDAEDVMHPDSLSWVNHYSGPYDFVQIPVLALPTPAANLTHGVYCDEFAEFQLRDLPVRNRTGGFVPSAGVGTGYSRRAVEALAQTASNRIFEPACLTEDYENGYRLHALGFRQIFVPVTRRGSPVATREFFPSDVRGAIRQRTRWTTGIALQSWERHGWSGGPRQAYWLWRDRKGLIGNPLSAVTNLVCAYAAVARLWSRWTPPPYLLGLLTITAIVQCIRVLVRIGCTTRVYGLAFSLLVPARALVANFINTVAVTAALLNFTRARIRREPLVWVKTEHAYPGRAALLADRRRLGEILVTTGYLDAEDLDAALRSKPDDRRLGEHLVAMDKLTEEDVYEALSLQQQLPLVSLDARSVPRRVARALPAHVAAKWRVLPFRIERGRLDVAGPELPNGGMETALRHYTALEIQFHLITPGGFRELEERLGLPTPRRLWRAESPRAGETA